MSSATTPRSRSRGDGALTASNDRAAARELAFTAARAADAKGGRDIVVLEVGDVLVVADEFVIVSAPNDRLVRAIVEEIERVVGERGLGKPLRIEGLDALRWVLMDYGDVIVHVFLDETRAYYELERLWSDVPVLDWAEADATASPRAAP
ncbi:MAG: ribosome silencing factor [Thermoanaerobacterales bacterium]